MSVSSLQSQGSVEGEVEYGLCSQVNADVATFFVSLSKSFHLFESVFPYLQSGNQTVSVNVFFYSKVKNNVRLQQHGWTQRLSY